MLKEIYSVQNSMSEKMETAWKINLRRGYRYHVIRKSDELM